MRKIPEEERSQIVADLIAEFPCFGRGTADSPTNPINEWTKDNDPVFALGVDVRKVLDFVLARLE